MLIFLVEITNIIYGIMRKTMFVLCTIALLAAASCARKPADGQTPGMWYGKDVAEVKKTFKVDGFEKIALAGSVDVKYVQGDTTSVIAKGTADMVERLDIKSDGTTLRVKYKDNNGIHINIGSKSAVVYVTSPDIVEVAITGSGDFRSKGHVDTDNMNIMVKGSGDVSFSDIICNSLEASVYGSGDVELKNVKAARTSFVVKGSGDISAKFDGCGTVESFIYGSGDISLKGKVRSEKHVIKGSGDVHTGKLDCASENVR